VPCCYQVLFPIYINRKTGAHRTTALDAESTMDKVGCNHFPLTLILPPNKKLCRQANCGATNSANEPTPQRAANTEKRVISLGRNQRMFGKVPSRLVFCFASVATYY